MATVRHAERRIVRQVSVASAAKVTFALALTVSAIFVVGLAALYVLGMASGALGGFESFVESLGWENFEVRFFSLLPFVIIACGIASGMAAALAASTAVLYNALTELVGGIEVITRDR